MTGGEWSDGDITVYTGFVAAPDTLQSSIVRNHHTRAVPQNPAHGPREIHTDPKRKDCFISVSFEQGTFYELNGNLPNGESAMDGQFGLGFTVSGRVRGGGGIGKIGDSSNKENPNGKWEMYQLTGDEITALGGQTFRDWELHTDLSDDSFHSADRNSPSFSWYDHPDQPTPPAQVTDYQRKLLFQVSVKNGNQFCSKTFSAIYSFNGKEWSAQWKEGY